MHNLGLTDLESLEDDKVVIPGLDVDAAMDNSIAMGKKKIRNKRIAQGVSVLSVLVLVSAITGAVLFNLRSDNPGVREKETASLKKEKNETTTTQAPTTQAPTTTVAPVIEPKLVSIRTFGDANVCNFVPQPNEDGVTVGSSKSVERFNAKVGDTFAIDGGKVLPRISMTVKAHNNATNGAFVDLLSGYATNGAYGSVTTLAMTYCLLPSTYFEKYVVVQEIL